MRQAYAAGEQEGLVTSLEVFRSSLVLLSALERIAADALACSGGVVSHSKPVVPVPVNTAYIAEVCRNARERLSVSRSALLAMEGRVLEHTANLSRPVLRAGQVAALQAPPMHSANQVPLQPLPRGGSALTPLSAAVQAAESRDSPGQASTPQQPHRRSHTSTPERHSPPVPAKDDGRAYTGALPPVDLPSLAKRVRRLATEVRARIAPPDASGDSDEDEGGLEGGGPVSPSALTGPPPGAPTPSPSRSRPGSSASAVFVAETPATGGPARHRRGQGSAFPEIAPTDEEERVFRLGSTVALAAPLGLLAVPPWAARFQQDAESDATAAAEAHPGLAALDYAASPADAAGRGPHHVLFPGQSLQLALEGSDPSLAPVLSLFATLDGTMGPSVCRSAVEYAAYLHEAWLAATGPVRELVLALQAVRWRITRVAAGAARDGQLRALVRSDFLGASAAAAAVQAVPVGDVVAAGDAGGAPASVAAVARASLVAVLLGCGHPLVLDSTLRLLNACASTPAARAYLLRDPCLVPAVVRVLLLHGGDTGPRQSAAGILQKVSTLKVPQDIMVRTGVMAWALRTLREAAAPSEAGGHGGASHYSIQYTCALVTTLAQRAAGRRSAVSAPAGALETLMEFLDSPTDDVAGFAAAAVYSLLANAHIRDQARRMGLRTVVKALMDRSGQGKPGLSFILTRLEGEEGTAGEESDCSDGEGYDSDEEGAMTQWLGATTTSSGDGGDTAGSSSWDAEDGDEGDPVVATVRDVWGEALLADGVAHSHQPQQHKPRRVVSRSLLLPGGQAAATSHGREGGEGQVPAPFVSRGLPQGPETKEALGLSIVPEASATAEAASTGRPTVRVIGSLPQRGGSGEGKEPAPSPARPSHRQRPVMTAARQGDEAFTALMSPSVPQAQVFRPHHALARSPGGR